MKSELWKREYLETVYSDMATVDRQIKIEEVLKDEAAFRTRNAILFKTGWDCCSSLMHNHVRAAMHEVGEE